MDEEGQWEVVELDEDERFDEETNAMFERLQQQKSDEADDEGPDAPAEQAGG